MKTLFIITIAAILTAISSRGQLVTNTFYSTFKSQGTTKKTGCGSGLRFGGTVIYRPTPTNNYHFNTNIIVAQFTNSSVLIEPESNGGLAPCGFSSVTATDLFYPDDSWAFVLYWPTNTPHPATNLLIPITVIGQTN